MKDFWVWKIKKWVKSRHKPNVTLPTIKLPRVKLPNMKLPNIPPTIAIYVILILAIIAVGTILYTSPDGKYMLPGKYQVTHVYKLGDNVDRIKVSGGDRVRPFCEEEQPFFDSLKAGDWIIYNGTTQTWEKTTKW